MIERRRYINIHEAVEGMRLIEPAYVVKRGVVRGFLPADQILDIDSLHRLRVLGAEFLCISEPDDRTSEEVQADTVNHVQRVNEIFSTADYTNPAVVALYDRVLIYKGAL